MNLSQVDLNLLVALDALLRERNVTRAGRLVALSQPAMSAALSRLRQLFGDPLLERVGREYRLTPLAMKLSEPLQHILTSIERTFDQSAPFEPATAQRTFKIAASDYVVCVILQPLLERVTRIAPGVKLCFQRAGRETPKDLADRRVDMSIEPEGRYREFESKALFTDHWMCAVWNGNTDVGRRITREQFRAMSHATYAHPPFRYSAADRFVGPLASELQVQVMSDSFVSLPLLLRGTRLITLVQARLGTQLRRAADIRLLRPPVPTGKLVVKVWWNSLYTHDEAHRWLRETIVDVMKDS
jgi:LysR family nod box-dependent transcriptional activator